MIFTNDSENEPVRLHRDVDCFDFGRMGEKRSSFAKSFFAFRRVDGQMGLFLLNNP